MGASIHRSQGHQIYSIGGSEDSVVVQCVLLPGNTPAESLPRNGRRDSDAVVDAGFNFGSFLVIVPGWDLDVVELVPRGVVVADIGQGSQPRLSTLLVE